MEGRKKQLFTIPKNFPKNFSLKKLKKDQILILLLAGILLLVISLPVDKKETVRDERTGIKRSAEDTGYDQDAYLYSLEQRLEQTLSQMAGVGDVTVMITLKSSAEKVVEKDLEAAKALATFEIEGKTLGFLGASRVIPEASWNASRYNSGVFTTYDASQLVEEIKKAKESCDFVAVLVHWGIERNTLPEDYQKTLARQYIDAGADAVIGSHPHVLQGIEYYQGKPIFYSLGNFIFGNGSYESIVAELTLTEGGTRVRVLPCASEGNRMRLLEETQDYYRRLSELSFGVNILEDGSVIE